MKQAILIGIGVVILLALSFWVAVYHFGPPPNLVTMPYHITNIILSPDESVEILHVKVEDNGIVSAHIKNAGEKRQVISFLARIEQYEHMNVFQEDFTEFYEAGEEKDVKLDMTMRGPGVYTVTLCAAQYDQKGMKAAPKENFWSETIHFRSE